ncbi:transcriptional regulator GcvA [Inquilinus limosus]|uniref:HTH lysR-type domain-containing protein n=1 Tax=Inquilinus limosus TaxID=171674 RepID=A0A211ZV68_9PROT|nr:transcriptional regulator GcvA [Inquilinus limosus]OWJ69181.1 hypothetical protein BWR60_01220 [Inquilinus limosus]
MDSTYLAPQSPPNWRRLPSLTTLRALEAVSRHQSLSRAADELCVTPAAVNHQIRQLEDHLGVPLLRRIGRNVVVTEAGEACLPGVREALDRLVAALAAAESFEDKDHAITVSVPSSFASKWLLPRLGRFQQAHPGIDLRIIASSLLSNFQNDGVDIAIRYGPGRYPDLTAELLMSETMFPVASPALLKNKPVKTPTDLRDHVLLHSDSLLRDHAGPTWPMWLRAAGEGDANPGLRGPRFTLSALAIEAAAQGEGIALAKSALAENDLRTGRLVRLFDQATPTEFAYYIVGPARNFRRPRIKMLIDWLHAEADASRQSSVATGREGSALQADQDPG